MTNVELRHIRERLCMSVTAFGRALGYAGRGRNIHQTISRYESGKRPVPEHVIERARDLLIDAGRPR